MSRLQVLTPSETVEALAPFFYDEIAGSLDSREVLGLVGSHPFRVAAVGVARIKGGLALYFRARPHDGLDPSTVPAGDERQIVLNLPAGRYLVQLYDATGETIGLESAPGDPLVCGFPATAGDLVFAIRKVSG